MTIQFGDRELIEQRRKEETNMNNELFYKSDYISSIPNSKYYFYYFHVVDKSGNKVDHPLNDRIASATLRQIDRAISLSEKKCNRLGIKRYSK